MKNVFAVSLIMSAALACIVSCDAEGDQNKKIKPDTSKKVAEDKGSEKKEEKTESPKVDMGKVSYIFGHSIGNNIYSDKLDITYDQFIKGLDAGLKGKKSEISEDETRKVMMAFQMMMREKAMQEQARISRENKEKGEAFLEANKKKAGIKVTKSGLQYKIVKAGTGEMPKATDTVIVRCEGKLLNGTIFQPEGEIIHPVNQFIPGWTEALQLMPVGSNWKLYIPSDLGYGVMGSPRGGIEPNETLIFDMTLIGIKKPSAEKPAEKKEEDKKGK